MVDCLAASAATADDHAPSGVHIAFGTRDDEMSVTWHTLASNPGDAVVEYSLLSDVSASKPAPSSRVEGTTRAFVDGGPERSVRFVHRVVLSNLEPGATYKYRVGNPVTKAYSAWFDFVAKRSRAQIAPVPREAPRAVRPRPPRIRGRAPARRGRGRGPFHQARRPRPLRRLRLRPGHLLGQNGDRFLADVEPVAARVPYMTSQGNHERAYNFSHYAERFTMPGAGVSNGNAYYSFDVGPAHVVAFNAEAFFWPEYFDAAYARRMYEWLVRDLRAANANRGNVPWILVHGHRPMYCVDTRVPDLTPHERKPEFDGACGWEKQAVRKGVASRCEDEYASLGCAAAFDAKSAESESEGFDVSVPRRAGPGGHVAPKESKSPEDFPIEKALTKRRGPLPRGSRPRLRALLSRVRRASGERHGRHPRTVREPARPSTSPRAPEVTPRCGRMRCTTAQRRRAQNPRGTCSHRAPWCAFQSGFAPKRTGEGYAYDFTYSRIKVHDDRTLEWEQVSAPSGPDSVGRGDGEVGDPKGLPKGEVIDRFVISAAVHGPFASRGAIATE